MALRAKKYFEDYDVETVLRNGKTVRRYVYKGDRYVREASPAARRAERAAYPPLALGAGVLLVAAMRQPVAANMGGIFAALSLLALIPAFCALEGSVEAFFRKGDLTKEDYRERLLMLRAMPAAGAALALLFAGGCLYDGLARGADTAANLRAALCAAGTAAIFAGLAAREFRVGYRVIKGSRSTGEDTRAGADALDVSASCAPASDASDASPMGTSVASDAASGKSDEGPDAE